MEFLVQPMACSMDRECTSKICAYNYEACPEDWCDNYCGDFDPSPGYTCGAYSTRSVGE